LLSVVGRPVAPHLSRNSGSQAAAAVNTTSTTKPCPPASGGSQQELINILEQVSFQLESSFHQTDW